MKQIAPTLYQRVHRFYASDIRLSLKIIATSLAIMVVGIAPLLVYAVLGPDNSNPMGLGFLALIAMFIGQLGLAVGFLRMLWEFFTERD